ncbi:hypothetical protein CRG98_027194 [Punica granatum]|uniref:Uncharacterized protein n=1 Tax=Punica granatum TaxID=22663 RepID=A0A2I0J8R8_PUNGR|nr:hypothetical protein CRG98_027194 [Punica granatum]
MHKEKSRGSGRGSRKTRVGRYGWVTRVKVQPRQSRENGSARLLRSRHSARSVGYGGHRNTGWFSDDFGRFRPWQGLDGNVGVGWSLRGFWREIGLREKENEEVIRVNDEWELIG